eukprot:GFKZ01000839.1.p1 GENE.GFKZ01000839.1~~GFKZ01000839.1.p1  ORF type:complete len:565 (+),score=72.70 GFKZ01000839.1:73-1767(+)
MSRRASLLFLLLRLHIVCHATASTSTSTSCAPPPPTPPRGCLPALSRNASLLTPCLTRQCYLFLPEPPFIILPPTLTPPSNPFPCSNPPQTFPLSGLAPSLHTHTSSNSAWCLYAGPPSSCSFNQLVDFISAPQMAAFRLAITGLVLETPQRQCHHVPSASILDNSMILLGRLDAVSAVETAAAVFSQLTQPFRPTAWAVLAAIIALFVIVCFAIACHLHGAVRPAMLTAFMVFVGARDEAMAAAAYRANANADADANASGSGSGGRKGGRGMAVMWRAQSRYVFALSMHRIAVLALAAVFLLFYEVAVVNFLFSQQTSTVKVAVTKLTREDLAHYAVLRGSALESLWNATVDQEAGANDGTDATIPWQRCNVTPDCIDWAANPDHPVRFVVTFDVAGRYLLATRSSCGEMMIFETKETLFNFNAGWLYNEGSDKEFRMKVDRELVGLRINGTTRRLIDEAVGDFSCEVEVMADIGPLVILVPCVLFVLPPLLGSLLLPMVLKGKAPGRGDGDREGEGAAQAQVEEGKKSEGEEEEREDSILGWNDGGLAWTLRKTSRWLSSIR